MAVILIAIAPIHPVGSLVSMPGAEFMGETERLTPDRTAWLDDLDINHK